MSGLSNILQRKTIAGVEVILLPSGGYEINAVVLRKKDKALVTEKQVSKLKSMEELVNAIGMKVPMVIVLNGKGIMHKKISFLETDTNASLLCKVLPNANPADFSVQRTFINEQQLFLSLIRSETLDGVLSEFQRLKLTAVSDCFLGPFVLNELFNQADFASPKFNSSFFELILENKRIIDLHPSESQAGSMNLQGESVPADCCIAFAAALSFYTKASAGIEHSETVMLVKAEYREKQKFELAGWSLLLFCLAVLTVNYFAFSHYWNKNNELTAQLVLNQSALSKLDTLRKEYGLKKEFLEQNGLMEDSRTSFFADRLAESLPASIHWTELVIHPIRKKQVGEEPGQLLFEQKTIRISGKCRKSTTLNEWMKEIKKKEWISSVDLLNYAQDKKLEDGMFTIQLKLK